MKAETVLLRHLSRRDLKKGQTSFGPKEGAPNLTTGAMLQCIVFRITIICQADLRYVKERVYRFPINKYKHMFEIM